MDIWERTQEFFTHKDIHTKNNVSVTDEFWKLRQQQLMED